MSDAPTKKKCLASKASDSVATTSEIITSKPTTATPSAKSLDRAEDSASKPKKLSDRTVGSSDSVEDPKTKKSKRKANDASAGVGLSVDDVVVESKSSKKFKKAQVAKEQEEIEFAKAVAKEQEEIEFAKAAGY